MFEEQKNESSEQMEDENKPTDLNAMEATSGGDEKPDINDVPMDENQVNFACFLSSSSPVVHKVSFLMDFHIKTYTLYRQSQEYFGVLKGDMYYSQ